MANKKQKANGRAAAKTLTKSKAKSAPKAQALPKGAGSKTPEEVLKLRAAIGGKFPMLAGLALSMTYPGAAVAESVATMDCPRAIC